MSTEIVLDKFVYRDYQNEVLHALEEKGFRNLLIVLPRRAGKDIMAWNIAIRQCIKKVCKVMYILPKYDQARGVIFDAISSEGVSFLNYIPKELIYKINISEMKVIFTNGSILKLSGGDTHNSSIRGQAPHMVIMSEFAYFRDGAALLDTVTPILGENNGKMLLISTVFGINHMYKLYNQVRDLPYWYTMYKTTDDINHLPAEFLAQEKARMSPAKYAQEYMNDWHQGVTGSYYGESLKYIEQDGQITSVPYDPMLLTYVAMDIGVRDATSLIFFQLAGEGIQVRIIDCYSNNNLGLDHYIKVMQDKPYRYSPQGYFAPHDMRVREFGDGAITRYEKGRQLGIDFTVLEQISFMDGIDNVRMTFPRLWIDKNKCRSLIDALENYRREWDEEKQIHHDKPIHNWASHYADSLRYLCQALPKCRIGMSAEDFQQQRYQALYGHKSNLPPQLTPNNDPYRR